MGKKSRSPAVFWGILDLKYDPSLPAEDRVKVLETGDGRSSKFSGYGASIKEAFEQDHKLEETIKCAVLTENKKLTHDTIVDCGYGHLRPDQFVFPKVYSDDLADSIQRALRLSESSICILKLCNRCRGAGVLPVQSSELDVVLSKLLQPPADVDEWLLQQPNRWFFDVSWGCFEEQVRHWWSNECPVFIAEACCVSAPLVVDGQSFDGTMRVGFSLHRELRDKLPQGWLSTPEGPVCMDEEAAKGSRPRDWDDDRPYLDLFRSKTSALRLQWLGAYWKLPSQDAESGDLRAKIVSVAKKGTAPVSREHELDVYTLLGDMVCQLFDTNTNTLSHTALSRKYSEMPEFGAFVVSRLAASMRVRDRHKSTQIFELARQQLTKLKDGPKDVVMSYILRNRGIFEVMHSRWESGDTCFQQSIECMPANAVSRYLAGLVNLEAGDPARAATRFEEALQLDPDFKAPYVCLGAALLRECQFAKTVEISEAGLNRHPVSPHAQYNLALGLFGMAVGSQASLPGENADDVGLCEAALAALEASRETRTHAQLWSEADEELLQLLRDPSARPPLLKWPPGHPREGWKLYSWRP